MVSIWVVQKHPRKVLGRFNMRQNIEILPLKTVHNFALVLGTVDRISVSRLSSEISFDKRSNVAFRI